MHNLQALQNDFQNYLLDKPSSIQAVIVDHQPVSAIERLAIYKYGYYLRLLEALQQDYQVLCALMGEEEFQELGREYILAYPSSFRSIRWYGEELAVFLRQQDAPLHLIEMVQFEWLLMAAFDAPDSAIVTVEQMAAIPFEQWPDSRFKLHASLRELNLSTNAVAIWQSYQESGVLLTPQQSQTVAPWIIWRKEYDVHFCSLEPSELYMIKTLAAGESFGAFCEGLCEWIDEQHVAMHAVEFFKKLILDQLIVEIL